MNSRVYRESSGWNEKAFAADPDNRLRWRMPRRRLEAEPLRDAMLSVSGLLDLDSPAGSLVARMGEGEVGRNLDTSVLDQPFDHRSVYLPIIRGIIPEQLRLFDFPEPSNVQGQRDSNTTPTQSLFLMNSDFAVRVARSFAEHLLSDKNLSDDARADSPGLLVVLCQRTDPQTDLIEICDTCRTFTLALVVGEKPPRGRPIVKTQRIPIVAGSPGRPTASHLVASAKFRFVD